MIKLTILAFAAGITAALAIYTLGDIMSGILWGGLTGIFVAMGVEEINARDRYRHQGGSEEEEEEEDE